jgi:hypothetical protein
MSCSKCIIILLYAKAWQESEREYKIERIKINNHLGKKANLKSSTNKKIKTNSNI